MGRAEIAALLAASYLAIMFVWHRLRLYRRRVDGPSLDLLRRFDYRVVWDPLLPAGETAGAPAPCAEAAAAPRAYATSPWELPEPPSHAALHGALLAGESPGLEPGDPEARWLACHFVIRRIFTGDLDGARELAGRLPPEAAEALRATVELARAERCASVRDPAGARRAVFSAFEHVERASRLQGATPALEYLRAHLQLAWLSHDFNLEWSVGGVLWRSRRSLRRWGEVPCLHFARAHAQALLGRHDETLDELARALYHSRGDPFYSRAILECGFVSRTRPALFAQCRALTEGRESQAASALSPGGADR